MLSCRLFILLPFFFILVFAGCDRNAPKDLIDEEHYIDILVEMHLLSAIKEIDGDANRYLAGQEAVLSHYGIEREQFQRSHSYYHRDMHEQMLRFREVRDRLDDLGTELTNRFHEERDTIAAP